MLEEVRWLGLWSRMRMEETSGFQRSREGRIMKEFDGGGHVEGERERGFKSDD